jgi:hypothetical protein
MIRANISNNGNMWLNSMIPSSWNYLAPVYKNQTYPRLLAKQNFSYVSSKPTFNPADLSKWWVNIVVVVFPFPVIQSWSLL